LRLSPQSFTYLPVFTEGFLFCIGGYLKLLKVLSRPIAFHRCLAELTGSVTAGLMLSQAVYWMDRTKDPDGWFWKTQDEWFDETMLSRKEQETARRRLKELAGGAVWQEQLRGVPAKLFYRVDMDALEALLVATKDAPIVQASMPESDILERPNRANKIDRIGQPLIRTETTTEITSETTQRGGEITVISQAAIMARPHPPTADAVSVVVEYFPKMPIYHQEVIDNAQINHLTLWRKCCEDWRDNRYSERNVKGLIDSYYKAESQQNKEKLNGQNQHNRRESHNERAARETFELIRQLTGAESGPDSSDPADTIFKLPPAFGGR
jgi:hypothetical protein